MQKITCNIVQKRHLYKVLIQLSTSIISDDFCIKTLTKNYGSTLLYVYSKEEAIKQYEPPLFSYEYMLEISKESFMKIIKKNVPIKDRFYGKKYDIKSEIVAIDITDFDNPLYSKNTIRRFLPLNQAVKYFDDFEEYHRRKNNE